MRRFAVLLMLLAAGCGRVLVADALDHAFPPRMPPPGTAGFGGVGIPQPAPPPSATPVPPVEQPPPPPAGAAPIPPGLPPVPSVGPF